jgi:hypothetical protein
VVPRKSRFYITFLGEGHRILLTAAVLYLTARFPAMMALRFFLGLFEAGCLPLCKRGLTMPQDVADHDSLSHDRSVVPKI